MFQAGARYAEGLLKALGIQQAIVVGHSAGALTAMEVFKRYASHMSTNHAVNGTSQHLGQPPSMDELYAIYCH